MTIYDHPFIMPDDGKDECLVCDNKEEDHEL